MVKLKVLKSIGKIGLKRIFVNFLKHRQVLVICSAFGNL